MLSMLFLPDMACLLNQPLVCCVNSSTRSIQRAMEPSKLAVQAMFLPKAEHVVFDEAYVLLDTRYKLSFASSAAGRAAAVNVRGRLWALRNC